MQLTSDLKDLLPLSMQELIDVIGIAATSRLVELKGGIAIKAPTKMNKNHWLYKAIGQQALESLIKNYAGERIEIARCEVAIRHIKEQDIIASDETGFALALKYNCTDRTIRAIKARHREKQNTNQIGLFNQETP